MGSIKIVNANIFDGEHFLFGDILAKDGRIAAVGGSITEEADYTFDADGALAVSGLTDIHTHMKGISDDAFGIPIDAVCFPFGVTCAVEASAIKGSRETLDAFGVKNRVFVATDVRDDHAYFEKSMERAERYGDKTLGFKVFFDASNTELRTLRPLCETVEFAQKHGLKTLVHCSNSPTPMADILSVLNRGDILTHSFHGKTHTAAEDNFESLREAQKRGVVIDIGFAGHVHTSFGVLKKAIRSGFCPNTLSTDITRLSAFVRGGRYGMTQCMSMAEACGMTTEQVLKAVTVNAAHAMGEPSIGRLAVGACADVAVLDKKGGGFDLTDADGNRLIQNSSYRCLLTVCDGNVVYRHE